MLVFTFSATSSRFCPKNNLVLTAVNIWGDGGVWQRGASYKAVAVGSKRNQAIFAVERY
jgi:hypothetical protein